MTDQRTSQASLSARLDALERENAELRRENLFLLSHPTFVAALKAEELIADLTGGLLTEYAAKHDIDLKDGIKIEVKFSNQRPDKNSHGFPKRHRWTWNKPLGYRNASKNYDFLLLVGRKDFRYTEEYLDKSPYVYFLLPAKTVRNIVPSIAQSNSLGGSINLDTDLYGIREAAGRGLPSKRKQMIVIEHMITEADVAQIEARSRLPQPTL